MNEFSNFRSHLPGMVKALAGGILGGIFFAWLRRPIPWMIIAKSPGGLAEMTILAQALHISVPLAVAFHFFRVVIVNRGT